MNAARQAFNYFFWIGILAFCVAVSVDSIPWAIIGLTAHLYAMMITYRETK